MYYIFGIISLIILGNCLIKRHILLRDIDICINQCDNLKNDLITTKAALDKKLVERKYNYGSM